MRLESEGFFSVPNFNLDTVCLCFGGKFFDAVELVFCRNDDRSAFEMRHVKFFCVTPRE